jgi:hypothetical protein
VFKTLYCLVVTEEKRKEKTFEGLKKTGEQMGLSAFSTRHPVVFWASCVVLVVSVLSLMNRFQVLQPLVQFLLQTLKTVGNSLKAGLKKLYLTLDRVFRAFYDHVVVFAIAKLAKLWRLTWEFVLKKSFRRFAALLRFIWNLFKEVFIKVIQLLKLLKDALVLAFKPVKRGAILFYEKIYSPVERVVFAVFELIYRGAKTVGKFLYVQVVIRLVRGILYVYNFVVYSIMYRIVHLLDTLLRKTLRFLLLTGRTVGKLLYVQVVLRIARAIFYVYNFMVYSIMYRIVHLLDTLLRKTLRFLLLTGRAAKNRLLIPFWRGLVYCIQKIFRFLVASAQEAKDYILAPLGRALVAVLKFIKEKLLLPLKRFLVRMVQLIRRGLELGYLRVIQPLKGLVKKVVLEHRFGVLGLLLFFGPLFLVSQSPKPLLSHFVCINFSWMGLQVIGNNYQQAKVLRNCFFELWAFLWRYNAWFFYFVRLVGGWMLVLDSFHPASRLSALKFIVGALLLLFERGKLFKPIIPVIFSRLAYACFYQFVVRSIAGQFSPLSILFLCAGLNFVSLAQSAWRKNKAYIKPVFRVTLALFFGTSALLFAKNWSLSHWFFVFPVYALTIMSGAVATYPPNKHLSRAWFYYIDFGVIHFLQKHLMTGRLKMLLLKLLANMRHTLTFLGNVVAKIFDPVKRLVKRSFKIIWKYPILAMGLVVVAVGIVVGLDNLGVDFPSTAEIMLSVKKGGDLVLWGLSIIWGYVKKINVYTAYRWFRQYFDGTLFKEPEFAIFVYLFSCVASHSTRNMVSYLYSKRLSLSARKAAITLLCIRKYRRNEMGRLGILPKEIIRDIAKEVYDSRYEKVWVRTLVD